MSVLGFRLDRKVNKQNEIDLSFILLDCDWDHKNRRQGPQNKVSLWVLYL